MFFTFPTLLFLLSLTPTHPQEESLFWQFTESPNGSVFSGDPPSPACLHPPPWIRLWGDPFTSPTYTYTHWTFSGHTPYLTDSRLYLYGTPALITTKRSFTLPPTSAHQLNVHFTAYSPHPSLQVSLLSRHYQILFDGPISGQPHTGTLLSFTWVNRTIIYSLNGRAVKKLRYGHLNWKVPYQLEIQVKGDTNGQVQMAGGVVKPLLSIDYIEIRRLTPCPPSISQLSHPHPPQPQPQPEACIIAVITFSILLLLLLFLFILWQLSQIQDKVMINATSRAKLREALPQQPPTARPDHRVRLSSGSFGLPSNCSYATVQRQGEEEIYGEVA